MFSHVSWVISWKYFGFHMILMLAGLQGIPRELEEAAAIDGAAAARRSAHHAAAARPHIRVSVFLSIIGAIQLFDLVWARPGAGRSTRPTRWRRTSSTSASGGPSSATAARSR